MKLYEKYVLALLQLKEYSENELIIQLGHEININDELAQFGRIEERHGGWVCTKCGHEYSGMLGDNEIPEYHDCKNEW